MCELDQNHRKTVTSFIMAAWQSTQHTLVEVVDAWTILNPVLLGSYEAYKRTLHQRPRGGEMVLFHRLTAGVCQRICQV